MEMIVNSSIESSLQYGDEKGKKGISKKRGQKRRISIRGGGEKKKNGDRSALILLKYVFFHTIPCTYKY